MAKRMPASRLILGLAGVMTLWSGVALANDDLLKQQQDPKHKRQPPYAVIVENDEEHTFQYVIEILQRICGHTLEEATVLTVKVHVTGRAVVWTGTMEVAELKRDQIKGMGTDFYARQPVTYPLGVFIEPMPQ